MIDRIAPIGFDGDDGIHINIYGRSGTGKTVFWATFPKPILAIVCSGSNKPGELRSINTLGYRKTIKQVAVEKTEEIFELIDYQSNEEKFATVVLDHASGLQDLKIKEILGLEDIPLALYKVAGKGESWSLVSRQQYGQVAIEMKECLRALLSLSCNVVIVAQEREFNTESDDDLLMPFVGSALTPSITGWLNPACDYICQTFIRPKMINSMTKVGKKEIPTTKKGKGVEYCLRTAPDPVFTTKFRLPRGTELPDVIVDPNFDKIQKLITQGG